MCLVIVVCCQVEVSCDGPTPRSTECEVSVFDSKTSIVRQARSECGCRATKKMEIYTENMLPFPSNMLLVMA